MDDANPTSPKEEMERELRSSQAFLQAVIDAIPDAMLVIGSDYRIHLANRAARELGAGADATGSWTCHRFSHHRDLPCDGKDHSCPLRQVLATKLPATVIHQHNDARGKEILVEVTAAPVLDKAGQLTHIIELCRDISDRKQAEESLRKARDDSESRDEQRSVELARAYIELEQTKEAAEAARRAKNAFLATMSHEIRTPLNAIIGLTALLLKSPLSVQQQEFLGTVADSAESLLALIDDVLDFSRLEAGKIRLADDTFDLWERLDATIKAFVPRAHQYGLTLTCQIHSEVPHILVGDYNRLRQIVVNLLGNAIKFTDQGGVVLDVTCRSLVEEDAVLQFTVSDTGIGIPAEKHSTIFEMFEQVDSSPTRRHGGAGLGLAIASRLVRLMEGQIWVESVLGRGSHFHFTAHFRLAKASTSAAFPAEGFCGGELPTPGFDAGTVGPGLALAVPGEISSQPPAGQPSHREKLRILLAEDSLVNQALAVALLEGEGHAVTVVGNGKEAVAASQAEKFDLILMDVQMPRMDGLDATARIRTVEKQTGAHVPIIAMTAHAIKGDRQRCLQAGMDGYVSKPIHAQELLGAVETLASRLTTPQTAGTGRGPELQGGAGPVPGARVEEATPVSVAPISAERCEPPVSPAQETEGVNWSEALRAVQGSYQLLKILVEAAIEETPRLMAAIRAAAARNDAAGMRLSAHTLKGSLRDFGEGPAYQQLCQLEKLAQERRLAETAGVVTGLETEIRRIVQVLQARLQNRDISHDAG